VRYLVLLKHVLNEQKGISVEEGQTQRLLACARYGFFGEINSVIDGRFSNERSVGIQFMSPPKKRGEVN
jgi:hypothetical protein